MLAWHRQLMTPEQDLELLRATRSRQQPHQREQMPHIRYTNVQSKEPSLDRQQELGT
jgi:hypothetical protein